MMPAESAPAVDQTAGAIGYVLMNLRGLSRGFVNNRVWSRLQAAGASRPIVARVRHVTRW